jgi:predicted transcriptional regulator
VGLKKSNDRVDYIRLKLEKAEKSGISKLTSEEIKEVAKRSVNGNK